MTTHYQVVRDHRSARPTLIAAALLGVLAIALPWWAPDGQASSWMREFVEIACYLIFAMMWNLLAGYGGMVSIGQQAFFGFGGYVMLMLSWGLQIGFVFTELLQSICAISIDINSCPWCRLFCPKVS